VIGPESQLIDESDKVVDLPEVDASRSPTFHLLFWLPQIEVRWGSRHLRLEL